MLLRVADLGDEVLGEQVAVAAVSRIANGSTPSSWAIRLMCVSTANEIEVTPNPRIAVVGTRFVKTT